MLWVYLTAAVMLVSGLRAEDSAETFNPEEATQEIQNFLEARCLKNANAEALEEVKETAMSLGRCLHESQRVPPQSEEEMFNFICSELPQTAYHCIGKLVRKLTPCLDEQEKYLPGFLGETFNSTVQQICKDGASHIAEVVGRLQSVECQSSLKDDVTEKCLPKLKIFQNLDETFVLRESDLCGDLHQLRECAIDIFKKECSNDVLEKSLENGLKPFLTWCSAHESENVVD